MKTAAARWLWLAAVALALACPALAGAVERVDFAHDVLPLLNRFGCNASACHGKAEGQNGFKLSVFGTDPKADREAIATHSRGRRIMPAAPEESLFMRKISGSVPHAGGPRIKRETPAYGTIRAWIAEGAPYVLPERSDVTAVRVEPPERIMGFQQTQPLRVLAIFADGSERDVTWLATFQSNNVGLADVDENGTVATGTTVGQAAIMARYLGRIAIFQAVVPRPGSAVPPTSGEGFNVLDD